MHWIAPFEKVARQLLTKLRGLLVADWQKTMQARARVQGAIDATLDDGLPRAYSPEVFRTKTGVLFQHVYERYRRAA